MGTKHVKVAKLRQPEAWLIGRMVGALCNSFVWSKNMKEKNHLEHLCQTHFNTVIPVEIDYYLRHKSFESNKFALKSLKVNHKAFLLSRNRVDWLWNSVQYLSNVRLCWNFFLRCNMLTYSIRFQWPLLSDRVTHTRIGKRYLYKRIV